MAKLKQLLDQFIDLKLNHGYGVRGAMGDAFYAYFLKQILTEHLLESYVRPTPHFWEALQKALRVLKTTDPHAWDWDYQNSVNNLAPYLGCNGSFNGNWVRIMRVSSFFVDFLSTADPDFLSLLAKIKQGDILPILEAIELFPDWLNIKSPDGSYLIIAALNEITLSEIDSRKRHNLLQFLNQVITKYTQDLNLFIIRDSDGNTVLHLIFWNAIYSKNKETARQLADLGCELVGLIRNTAAYSAIIGIRNNLPHFPSRPEGETFIDYIYFFHTDDDDLVYRLIREGDPNLLCPFTRGENLKYLHDRITPILYPPLHDVKMVDPMASTPPRSSTTTGHTSNKNTSDKGGEKRPPRPQFFQPVDQIACMVSRDHDENGTSILDSLLQHTLEPL